MSLLLAADIGGTKSVLGIFDLHDGLKSVASIQAVYASRDFAGIEEIIHSFLEESGCTPEYACLAVAGVIRHGQAKMTNLPWLISERVLAARFGFTGVWLVNDLTAVCSSLPLLRKNDFLELQPGAGGSGASMPCGVMAVIAPGTGLGEGFLLQKGEVVLAQGTEGGHGDFAPTDATQASLLDWMRRHHPWPTPVSYEMLCSGMAIPTLYAFFQASGMEETPAVSAELKQAADQTPVIINSALDDKDPCPLCRKSVETFLAILGAEAGNLALKLYSTGGLYIGGGIMPRLVGRISFAPLLAAFNNKEKMEALMATIPVRLITRKDTALLGAASYGEGMVLLLQRK
ncbi:MAG: glucokinase [Proteobacteria bacterium]|nr:glucokinase [Pseudomonadota bacterium]MBU1650167.1 glucokinase [Pseudomonadota bacterium]MBU1986472.1 glucokinase [Pseudomonadota bacterium]